MVAYSRGKYQKKTYTKQEPVPFKAPTFTPSAYQVAIVDAIVNTIDNLIVDAVAGSGKTSTLALIVAKLLELAQSYIVVAFNKSIETELKARGMNARTFHSLGYASVVTHCQNANNGVKPDLDAQKVSRIVDTMFGRDSAGYSGSLCRLVSLAKNHMFRPNVTDVELIGLIDHFDIEWEDRNVTEEQMCEMVRRVLRASNDDTRTIDFDDQLYLVFLHNLRMPTFDFVLVDESQDTNPLRRDLAARMMRPNSRIIAVGDPRQAIYGFTGASHDSMDLIAERFACKWLPLSVSYRCPVSVVKLAQTIVPHIQARENAPEGTVVTFPTFKRSQFVPTDLLICRNTAPLVQTAYKLLSARIPCRIMGREIGKSLTSLITKLSRKNETLETLLDRLLAHRDQEVEKAMRQKKETKAQNVQDKVDAIVAIIDSMTPEDVARGIPGLVAIIDGMFSDQRNGCVTLATVHKAKGLEAPRVFILDRQLMPSRMARQEWQLTQEHNLIYVAYTRALDTLAFVETKDLVD